MSKPVAAVVGSSRGIGIELAKQLTSKYEVYGTMRKPFDVEFKVLKMDVNDQSSVDEAAKQIEKLVSLNNASFASK